MTDNLTLNASEVICIDRREGTERRQKESTGAVKAERRKGPRRRQIDPTTCERDYSPDEIEFMQAMDAYKRKSGRMFPTCSEVLEVVRMLGYQKPLAMGLLAAGVAEAAPVAMIG